MAIYYPCLLNMSVHLRLGFSSGAGAACSRAALSTLAWARMAATASGSGRLIVVLDALWIARPRNSIILADVPTVSLGKTSTFWPIICCNCSRLGEVWYSG